MLHLYNLFIGTIFSLLIHFCSCAYLSILPLVLASEKLYLELKKSKAGGKEGICLHVQPGQ